MSAVVFRTAVAAGVRRGVIACMVTGLVCAPLRARAQELHARVGIANQSIRHVNGSNMTSPGQVKVTPHVLGGAAIGAAAMILGLVIASNRHDDGIMHPITLAPAVALGAAVGALGGYVVYRVRRE